MASAPPPTVTQSQEGEYVKLLFEWNTNFCTDLPPTPSAPHTQPTHIDLYPDIKNYFENASWTATNLNGKLVVLDSGGISVYLANTDNTLPHLHNNYSSQTPPTNDFYYSGTTPEISRLILTIEGGKWSEMFKTLKDTQGGGDIEFWFNADLTTYAGQCGQFTRFTLTPRDYLIESSKSSILYPIVLIIAFSASFIAWVRFIRS